MTYITVEETLKAFDLPDGLVPELLMSQMLLTGASIPTVWLGLVSETSELVGKDGTTIKIPFMTAMTALTETADNVEDDAFSFTVADPTVTKLDISVLDLVYCAFQLSRILIEDCPSIDWLRAILTSAGSAIMNYMNADIRDTFTVASGTETASCTSLSYSEVIDARAKLETSGWLVGDDTAFLVVSVANKNILLKENTYVSSQRYTISDLDNLVEGEIGMFAGCRVVVDPALEDDIAFIIAGHERLGAVSLIVWKRHLQMKSEARERKEKDFFVETARYKFAIVQPLGICIITISSTP